MVRAYLALLTAAAAMQGLTGLIDCGAGVMQSVFPGKLHARELFIPVMNGHGSFGVLDQRIIASPIALLDFLMHLHFDLDAFVDGLNHSQLPCPLE
jgi:hypothetical protein